MIRLQEGYSFLHFAVKELDEGKRNRIVGLIQPLYTWFSPQRASYENIVQRLTRNENSKIDIIIFQNDVVGWGIYYTDNIGENKILYRDGTIIHQEHTSKGLYRVFIDASLEREHPDYLITRTQNPRVYESFKRYEKFGGIYPQLDGALPPIHIQVMAKEIEPDIEVESLIVRGVFGGDRFYAEYHTSRDPRIKQFFQEKLQPPDAFLVIVPLF